MQVINSIAVSKVGNIRTNNEDAIVYDQDAGFWIVADGMGGHSCGEVASELAVTTVSTALRESGELKAAIELAHQSILQQSELNPEQKGMGTTLVAAQQTKNGFKLGWVGDSRAYCYAYKLRQLTADHTFVQDMVYREVLTPEEAESHVQRNLINRSLGMEKGAFKVDSFLFKPKKSGFLLLCTDGVSDYVNSVELEKIFQQYNDIQSLADAIIYQVLITEAGDNFSFVLVEYKLGFISQWCNILGL